MGWSESYAPNFFLVLSVPLKVGREAISQRMVQAATGRQESVRLSCCGGRAEVISHLLVFSADQAEA